jgi:hypothetical protein
VNDGPADAGGRMASRGRSNPVQLSIVNAPSQPQSLAGAVVCSPLHCRGCGYNLYGLSAEGRCPECGLEIWETVLHTVDPAASRLPKLRNPRAVGNGLFWLTLSLFVAALILVARPVARRLDTLDPTGLRDISAWIPPYLALVAGVVVLAGLRAVGSFAPPKGQPLYGSIGRDIRLLVAGMIVWVLLISIQVGLEYKAVPAWGLSLARIGAVFGAMVGLFGLDGILRAIGQRSREFRTARGGRQGVLAMIGALAGVVFGEAMGMGLAISSRAGGGLATMGMVVTSISTLMLLIGLAYLVVNGWWIRRALCRPPPALDEILDCPADQAGPADPASP